MQARITTRTIWSITGNDLLPRKGTLQLESDQSFINESDTLGPLHVATGLRPRDVAVFLRFRPIIDEQELPREDIGYLVTAVGESSGGSGILVSGELVERHPASFVTQRVIGAWGLLRAEGYSPNDYGLIKLSQYLDALLISQSTPKK